MVKIYTRFRPKAKPFEVVNTFMSYVGEERHPYPSTHGCYSAENYPLFQKKEEKVCILCFQFKND